MKALTIVGTRPELIKMSRVIACLDANIEHILVHTGQNYDFELNQVFFDDLSIRKPDYFLDAVGESTAQTIGNIISKADEVLEKENPDAVLLYGDTNSCLSVIAAKRRKIPVFHMEAGNRCFDQNVPEELNRKIVDHLSDINMVLTEHARRYLISEGLRPETVIKTGSHMKEILSHYSDAIQNSTILSTLELTKHQYFLISIHREENVDDENSLKSLVESLHALASKFGHKILVSTHPRTRKRLDDLDMDFDHPLISFLKPFGFTDYVWLQMNAFCVLSDSGTITEEASLLQLPAVTLRNNHERPEGMDVGALVMSGLRKDRIVEAVKIVTDQHFERSVSFPTVDDYDTATVSEQVLRIILSYTDYVDRTVWRKY